MQGLMRLICIGYLIFLTALLLTADPLRLVGVRGNVPQILRTLMPYAHLLSFLGLGILALTARWPLPRWAIALILVLYGGLTEVVQGFLPPRAAELGDWLQDLAGITAGAVLCWGAALAAGALMGWDREPQPCALPATSDEWDVVRNVMSRRALRRHSWWT